MDSDRPKDLWLWACPLLLWLFGLYGLWSLSRGVNYPLTLVHRQAGAGVVGVALGLLCSRLRWRQLARLVPWSLAAVVVALGAVLVVGVEANGAQRWLSLGSLGTFQPSELAKLVTVLFLAQQLGRRESEPGGRALLLGALGMGTMAVLIFKQPDLGTSLVLLATGGCLFFLSGVSWLLLTLVGVSGLGVLPLLLSEYQRQRIRTFFSPQADPSGAGWNLQQSKIAIGSGGIWGKGPFQGLQGPLDFLPEAHSDFIFSALGEEFGFAGCLTLVLITSFLVGRLLWHAQKTSHPFQRLALAGLGVHFGVHALLNMGMTIGLLPVTGSPLPFVSFGGTALVCNFLAIGVAQSALGSQRF